MIRSARAREDGDFGVVLASEILMNSAYFKPTLALLIGPTRHLFLSPHYDDIALSCGGSVARLAQADRAPKIIVAFGGEPDPNAQLSQFALDLHATWGLSSEGAIAARRREESIATSILGATWLTLPFSDAIYRGSLYETGAQLFGEPAPSEDGLPIQIASAARFWRRANEATRIYAPLAVGGHVDHRHSFRVGVELARSGWDVWFYDDLPYALRNGALETRVATLRDTFPHLQASVVDVSNTWATKLAAISAYRSQLDTIFRRFGGDGTLDQVDRLMRTYASKVGDQECLAERFWHLNPSGLPISPSQRGITP